MLPRFTGKNEYEKGYGIETVFKRIARLVSEDAGKNRNNQIAISHGIQVLLDRELERRKSLR